jgi:hypothetical protein
MNEQFDKTLRNHIKDTFGSYDDQYAADGWNSLINKKRRKRRGLVFWYSLPSGIAAALAIVWMYNWNTLIVKPATSNKMIAKTEKTIVNEKQNIASNETNNAINTTLNNVESTKTEAKAPVNKTNFTAKNLQKQNASILKQAINSNTNLPEKNIEIGSDDNLLLSILNDRKSSLNSNEKQLVLENNSPIQNTELRNPVSIEMITNNVTTRETEVKIPPTNKNSVAKKSLPKSFAFNAIPANVSGNNNTAKQNKFNVAVDANTYYSFSDRGVNDQVNIGIGLATTYKIGKNFSINSGILLNRQTSSFEGLSRSSFDSRLAVNSAFAIVPNAQITNAKLIGLDIPVNLQFDFKIGKAKTFITSGFSSYSVINEEYVNDFSVTNYLFTGVKTSNITTVQDNPAGSFTYFKLARTLNFSFGMLYPLKGKSSVSVEPFLKYPIAGFGYQDLLIGSGGVSLKYNFNK